MNRRMALAALAVGALAATVGFLGCASAPEVWGGAGSPRVVVTFPPLYCFARNVAGDHGAQHSLCISNGPHSYVFDAGDARWLRRADLFLANGLGLEPWARQLDEHSQNPKLVFAKLGDRLPKDLLLKAEHDEDEKGHAGHEHEHGEYDPHVWLGTPQAVALVTLISHELKRVDPGHAEDYSQNANKYAQALKNLQKDGLDELKAVKDRKLISFHDSLRYFAKSFELTIVDVIEEGPGDEPTGPKMVNLVNKCVAQKVRVIAVEPQYPQTTSAKVLQDELKKKNHAVRLVEIDPLETADVKEFAEKDVAGWYEKKMRQNVKRLAESLK